MSNPTTLHLEATKRVLRYIRGTLNHGISFSSGPLTLTAFSDADWAGDPFDRRSTTGLVFLGPSPISWSSKKQTTVTRSSTEAEYRALATTAAKVSWLRILFRNYVFFFLMSLFFGVTMHPPLLSLPILCSIRVPSTSRLTTIMFVKKCCVVICVCALCLARTTLLIYSQSLCHLPRFFFNGANFCWMPPPKV